MTASRIGRAWRRLTRHPDWNIGVAHAPPEAFLDETQSIEVTWFPRQSRDQFIADPFAIVHNGSRCVFFERFDYTENRGVIQCCALDDKNDPDPAETVLSAPHHLSYPFVFEHQGAVFMIPETYEAGEVALYRAEDFPVKWEKERTLIADFPGLDCTPFRYEDRWWLAGTRHEEPARYDLHLWFSDELLGDWTPHPGNPVKSCPESSRPGGKPFEFSGHLYRPAQNCAERYGGSLVLNRIVTLNPREFVEETACERVPFISRPYGFHTLCGFDGVTFVDGCGQKFVPAEARRVLRDWFTGAENA
jgi:hypothetical protein